MSVISNKGVIHKAIPKGMPKVDENFELVNRTIDTETILGEKEFLLRNLYLSVDPYIRPLLDEAVYIFKNIPVGEVISCGGVSEVVKTSHPDYKVGDILHGPVGWEEYSHIKPENSPYFNHFTLINKDKDIPLSYYVSFLNLGGLTAYASLLQIGKPKEGETIVVSAAAGFTGHLVGQIAKMKGLKVVGSTGSDEKVDFLLNELKFDAAFNYKKVNLDEALSKHCPDGIDIYYDNVGGELLEAVTNHCNKFARIVVSGMISQYNTSNPNEKYGVKTLQNIYLKRITMQGFIITDYMGSDIEKEFHKDIVEWVKSGKIICKEYILVGVENSAKAFVDMLEGKNIGKTLVKVVDF